MLYVVLSLQVPLSYQSCHRIVGNYWSYAPEACSRRALVVERKLKKYLVEDLLLRHGQPYLWSCPYSR
jgi:hypothetical protein